MIPAALRRNALFFDFELFVGRGKISHDRRTARCNVRSRGRAFGECRNVGNADVLGACLSATPRGITFRGTCTASSRGTTFGAKSNDDSNFSQRNEFDRKTFDDS